MSQKVNINTYSEKECEKLFNERKIETDIDEVDVHYDLDLERPLPGLETTDENNRHQQVERAREAFQKYIKITKFSDMAFYLDTGMNIFVYGVGSKRQYLNEFSSIELRGNP